MSLFFLLFLAPGPVERPAGGVEIEAVQGATAVQRLPSGGVYIEVPSLEADPVE